ncbi:MAG TPA: hypothetical protein VFO19_13840 [Vicinamibacterales bacterium]|jgi:hypothetical protein|nr:hypothetical protein [Vicinamibacterales bacterium]
MVARRRRFVAIAAIVVSLAAASLDAQRFVAPPSASQPFNPVPRDLPPLHISGETKMRLRNASIDSRLPANRWLQTPEPTGARTPERIRRAVVTLTALAASAMVLLLVAAWLFLRRRQP